MSSELSAQAVGAASDASPDPRARRAAAQHVFSVERSELVSPHLVRVHLGGPAFGAFVAEADPSRLAATDKYVKLLFAKPELGLTPPYDLDALRERLSLEDMPARRTYTVRLVDYEARTIAIDFVVHGDEGIAGPWAAAARPGDVVSLTGPGGAFAPAPDPSIRRLLLGDEAAIPAIAAALESMPAEATGTAAIEVDGPADEIALTAPSGVEVRWLHREAGGRDGNPAQPGTVLVDALRAMLPPAGPIEVFVHGERQAMKDIRAVLQDVWGLERRSMSLSAYWALGRAEDGFQAEKREKIGQIFPE
jgi:NADPH-dependent ferric siderophore reductase